MLIHLGNLHALFLLTKEKKMSGPGIETQVKLRPQQLVKD